MLFRRPSQGVTIRQCPGFSLPDRYYGNAARVGQLLLLPDQLKCRLYALLTRSAGIAVRVSMDEQDMEGANVATRSFENAGLPGYSLYTLWETSEFSNVPDLYYVIGVKYRHRFSTARYKMRPSSR